jgi:transcriptional regulator with PAS, ATPase and Fis domain
MMKLLGSDHPKRHLSKPALDALVSYDWPGNLRQLASTLRTLIVLHNSEETIELSQLPAEIQKHQAETGPAKTDLKQLTRQAIQDALAKNGNNVSAAARQLGIHRSTLYRQMAKQSNGIKL